MRSSDLLNLSIYSRGHPTTTQYSKISHDYLASGAARGSLHNNHVPHITSKPTTGLIRKFIYGPGIDESIAMINVDAGVETWYFYHYDGLGSVVALSKYNTGTSQVEIVERYSYDAFGTTTITTTSGCTSPGNPYMFTARRLDPETGLYYYRARIYSPALGRFLQPDPIGYADGMNMYAYCGNNPVNYIDPWGLKAKGNKDEPIFLDDLGNVNPRRVNNNEVHLTENDLLSEIEYFKNNPNVSKKLWDIVSADTRFHKRPAKGYKYLFGEGTYDSSQVNYIGVGTVVGQYRISWIIAKRFPDWHNNGVPKPIRFIYNHEGYGHIVLVQRELDKSTFCF